MGCCESSFSQVEVITYRYILSSIPTPCQGEVYRLPPRKFLAIYQQHLDAETHFRQGEYLAAIACEHKAIEGLEHLLRHHKDHFIFADMHKMLEICYWNMGNIEQAYLRGVRALGIRMKYASTDYTQISLQYYRLALIYLVVEKWKEVEECLDNALIIGRLSSDLPQTYLQELETALIRLKEQINNWSRRKSVVHHFPLIPGGNQDQLANQTVAEMLSIIVGSGPVQVDDEEYERLPDKQTESQVTDEILNDVLQHLEKYLQEDKFLCKFGRKGGSVSFIAAYFKATQMESTSLSAAMIEAALTIIIDRINKGNAADDGRFPAIKQSPLMISYTDNDESRTKGVRVFQVGERTLLKENDILFLCR